MIRVRFNNVADDGRLIGYALLPQVPEVGEIVNLDGHPWLIYTRAWATKTARRVPAEPPSELYAYLECVPFKPPPRVKRGKALAVEPADDLG